MKKKGRAQRLKKMNESLRNVVVGTGPWYIRGEMSRSLARKEGRISYIEEFKGSCGRIYWKTLSFGCRIWTHFHDDPSICRTVERHDGPCLMSSLALFAIPDHSFLVSHLPQLDFSLPSCRRLSIASGLSSFGEHYRDTVLLTSADFRKSLGIFQPFQTYSTLRRFLLRNT